MSGGIVTATLWGRDARTVRRHDEDDLQRDIVRFLTVALPADATFYAVPNGGKRHKREAARLVGLGVRAGVPDLAVVHRGRALFLELKAKAGYLSQRQREMHRELSYAGAAVCVVRSVAEAEAALLAAAVPLRASLAA